MRPRIIHIAVTITISLVCVFSAPGPAAAGESDSVEQGFYMGGMFVYNYMDGDFDDSSYYSSSSSSMIYDVPEVESGLGFGVVAGVRLEPGCIELGYHKTFHDTNSSFTFVGDGADYNVIDLNFKFDVLSKDRLRPYLLVGFGYTWLNIQDSATADGISLKNEKFTGYCLNAGTGLSYFVTSRWAVTGGVIYRWNNYGSVENAELKNRLKESALGFQLGMTYTF